MKKSFRILLLLAMCIAACLHPVTAKAAGDSISDATAISMGNTYHGSITVTNEGDFYQFTLGSSGEVKLTATAEISRVNYCLYNGTGEKLWEDDYDANASGQSHASETFDLTAGTYYFSVEKDWDNTGTYFFQLDFTSAGESFPETGWGNDNTIPTANSIAIGATYKGQIAGNDEKDFYKFTINSSGRVTLAATAEISSVDYRLYNDTGEKLWEDEYDANASGQSHASEAFDLTKGTYYFSVEKDYWKWEDAGTYSFQLNFASAGESFGETGWGTNNTIATANSINTGVTYKGQIANNDQKDFYKFTVGSSGKCTLTSTASISRVDYKIYSGAGDELWSHTYSANDGGQSHINETFDLTAGTYYFSVERDWYAYTGNYSFRIAPHVHSYKAKVTKATTFQNGKIEYECSCGAKKQSTIYYPKKISLSAGKYIYNGKAKKPSVTVKGSNGKIISPSNYTVKYAKGRKNVGKYAVNIVFKGNYSGSVRKEFVINPKGTQIAKLKGRSRGFTVSWRKQRSQVTGYQVQYATNKKFSGRTTKTIKKNTTASATYKKLRAKKKYYVRVRTYKTVGGTKYYSSWSPAKTVTTKR